MAIKQWGFVHIPRTMDAPQRADFLVGYPFAFGALAAARSYYTGGISAAKRLLRGFGF